MIKNQRPNKLIIGEGDNLISRVNILLYLGMLINIKNQAYKGAGDCYVPV
jgi:hypothetical protein